MEIIDSFIHLDYSSAVTLFIFILTFCLVFYSTRRPQGIPPGPALFPVIGNLPSFAGDILSNLASLRQKYGDVYSLYVGNELMVFLNGHDAVHEALVKKGSKFKRRPNNSFDRLVNIHPGIVYADGALWKEQRMFALKALQELCFKDGGKTVEEAALNEVRHLGKTLENMSYPADVEHVINIAFTNVVCVLLYKHRFDYEDQGLKKVLLQLRENVIAFMNNQLSVNCFPFLSVLPFDVLGIKAIHARYQRMLEFFRNFIEQLKQNHTEETRNTVVDLYLIHQMECEASGVPTTCSEEQLEYTIFDLVAAGSETSATTIRWILAYLIRFPDIQEKMFAEIHSTIGEDKPTLSDRKRLPYTQAVILEGLRLTAVAPLAIPHSVEEDTHFRGYKIPEGCTVMINIPSSNKDPMSWNKPEEFIPERFLSDDGTEVITPKELITFSLGQRSCLGESLARFELFLVLTSLVQMYRFLAETDESMPIPKGKLGLTWCPESYKIRILKR